MAPIRPIIDCVKYRSSTILEYQADLICYLNFLPNRNSPRLKSQLGEPSKIFNLFIMRLPLIKNKVLIMFLIILRRKSYQTHFCHYGSLQPSETVSASP